MPRLLALSLLLALPAWANVTVPADVGIGPEAFWFAGPLFDNRGAIPHFALAFNVQAIINKETVEQNWDRIPPKYRGMASGIKEMRVGASIFIPDTIYISPKIDELGGVGLYGATWAPIGLTLASSEPTSSRDWNKSRGKYSLDVNLILTALYLYSDFPAVPPTFFLRPGLELRFTLLVAATKSFLISFGGGAQAYVPQRLGAFLDVLPIEESLWLAGFAFFKFHFRFPYEIKL